MRCAIRRLREASGPAEGLERPRSARWGASAPRTRKGPTPAAWWRALPGACVAQRRARGIWGLSDHHKGCGGRDLGETRAQRARTARIATMLPTGLMAIAQGAGGPGGARRARGRAGERRGRASAAAADSMDLVDSYDLTTEYGGIVRSPARWSVQRPVRSTAWRRAQRQAGGRRCCSLRSAKSAKSHLPRNTDQQRRGNPATRQRWRHAPPGTTHKRTTATSDGGWHHQQRRGRSKAEPRQCLAISLAQLTLPNFAFSGKAAGTTWTLSRPLSPLRGCAHLGVSGAACVPHQHC